MARFFTDLESYRRLVSVNNVTMSGEGNNLTATFSLTRYVGGAAPTAASS
jgi:hypothetical protein